MKKKNYFTIVLLLVIGMSFFKYGFADDAVHKKSIIHEIHYYAKNYYREGKYVEAIKAYQKILLFSPGHEESEKIIAICNRKLALVGDMFSNAQVLYRKGDLVESLKIAEQAYAKDTKNYESKTLLVTILTELGIEFSVVEQREQGLDYLERAHKIVPDDPYIKQIRDEVAMLVESFKEPKAEDDKGVEQRMMKMFESYRQSQSDLKKDFEDTKQKLEDLLKKTAEIQAAAQTAVEAAAAQNTAKKSGPGTLILYIILPFILIAGFFAGRGLRSKQKLQASEKRVVKAISSPGEEANADSETAKKIKQLEMIEAEASNAAGQQMILNMLEKHLDEDDFFSYSDIGIRYKAVVILYTINPRRATGIFSDILEKTSKQKNVIFTEDLNTQAGASMISELFKTQISTEVKEVLKTFVGELVSRASLDESILEELKNYLK